MSREVPRSQAVALLVLLASAPAGCGGGSGDPGTNRGAPLDSVPRLLNDSLPFRYPVGLYMQLIEDSVTLRLHVDAYGRPVAESTRVAVAATHAPFDTAALEGADALVFRPAIRGGKPVAVTILFPITFRVPGGPPAGATPDSVAAGSRKP